MRRQTATFEATREGLTLTIGHTRYVMSKAVALALARSLITTLETAERQENRNG